MWNSARKPTSRQTWRLTTYRRMKWLLWGRVWAMMAYKTLCKVHCQFSCAFILSSGNGNARQSISKAIIMFCVPSLTPFTSLTSATDIPTACHCSLQCSHWIFKLNDCFKYFVVFRLLFLFAVSFLCTFYLCFCKIAKSFMGIFPAGFQ